MMTDKTKINRKFLGTIRVLLTLCVGTLLLQSAFSQEQELRGKAKGKVRKSEEATPHRIVIAPVTTVFSFIMGYSSNIWQTNLQKKKD